jgi:FKBP-type peptidyl-prolyl cis-trans isomerase FkpA
MLAAALAAGCAGDATTPSQFAPFSQTDTVIGTGAQATSGSTVTVDYTGWLYDPTKSDKKGLQFDTSVGKTPFQFTLGAGQVIEGWEKGVPGMNVGGTRRLIIPPSLAYGDTRSGAIPANSTLVFDITMIAIAAPAAQ